MGRFLTSDTWKGNAIVPISFNRWLYGESNPINQIDPTGNYSEDVITASLHGKNIRDVFGIKRYNVARWGLYNLLKNASLPVNRFTLRIADFGYDGLQYPLAPDFDGNWFVYENNCELVFVNNRWGFKTLTEFMDTLNYKAELNTNINYTQWWRPASLQYHWYESNGHFYSDFYEFSVLPDFLMINAGLFAGGYGALGSVRDRFGNQYYSVGAGFALPVGLGEHWEGYASINRPSNYPREWRVLSESELKSIILEYGFTLAASWVSSGVGIAVNRTGTIGLYGDINALLGISGGGSWTWEAATKDYSRAWDWVNDIPKYGPPQN